MHLNIQSWCIAYIYLGKGLVGGGHSSSLLRKIQSQGCVSEIKAQSLKFWHMRCQIHVFLKLCILTVKVSKWCISLMRPNYFLISTLDGQDFSHVHSSLCSLQQKKFQTHVFSKMHPDRQGFKNGVFFNDTPNFFSHFNPRRSRFNPCRSGFSILFHHNK